MTTFHSLVDSSQCAVRTTDWNWARACRPYLEAMLQWMHQPVLRPSTTPVGFCVQSGAIYTFRHTRGSPIHSHTSASAFNPSPRGEEGICSSRYHTSSLGNGSYAAVRHKSPKRNPVTGRPYQYQVPPNPPPCQSQGAHISAYSSREPYMEVSPAPR